MVIKLFTLYTILITTICSFIGYGSLFKIYKLNSVNIFNLFFFGLVVINIISFFYYLLIPNNPIINLIIIFFGFFLYFKNLKFFNFKYILIISTLFFLGLIISKTHEDFSVYHYQHIKELTDNYLKFGLANLDHRYSYSSIFSYIQGLFKLPYFNLYLILIPVYSIYISLIGYLFSQISNKNKDYLNFIYTFFLLLLVVKFKRLSEFGYDYIGQFILIYVFIEFVLNKNSQNYINNKLDGIIIFLYTLLIKISNFYFLPILFYTILKNKIDVNKMLFQKKFLIFSFFILSIFLTNSFLKTGCINYLLEFSCLTKNKISWVIDYKEIENTKKLSTSWSRGFYHQKKEIETNELSYNSNLNWLPNWVEAHFIVKILPFIFVNLILLLIIKVLIFKNNKNLDFDYSLFFSVIASNLIWLYFFPQFRFGFASISILICLVFIRFFHIPFKINYLRFLILFSIFVIYFNFSNIVRINKEFKREDIYKFTNFPFFSLPSLNFDYYIDKNFKYNRSKKNDNFWRTCFNSNLVCVNHDQNIEFNEKKRLLFISKL